MSTLNKTSSRTAYQVTASTAHRKYKAYLCRYIRNMWYNFYLWFQILLAQKFFRVIEECVENDRNTYLNPQNVGEQVHAPRRIVSAGKSK